MAGTATSCWCARGWSGRCTRIRLPGLEPRGALVADLDLAAGPVRVVAAHLGLLRQSRLLQIETLLHHARAATDRPVVFMGDLNEWRRQGRSSLMHTQTVFGPLGHGVPSFPAYYPVLALDRVFVLPSGRVESFAAHDSPLARVASDHLPVKARVRLTAEPLATPRPTAAHPLPAPRPRLFARRRSLEGPRP
ncbi:MAG: endonuclease [Amaricoccus sp.]|uniref:endonuclease/exonuclease/phosphatase family protein n=1 Tax=Amaricoccus sp. TaxID=1872485 RepID=UPI0039E32F1C